MFKAGNNPLTIVSFSVLFSDTKNFSFELPGQSMKLKSNLFKFEKLKKKPTKI